MVKKRRLCLGCLADWMEVGTDFCVSCLAERKQAKRASHEIVGGYVRDEPSEWWGPTRNDIDTEDSVPYGYQVIDPWEMAEKELESH